MGRVTWSEASREFFLTLDQAQEIVLDKVGKRMVDVAVFHAPGSEEAKRRQIRYKRVGKTTVVLEVDPPLSLHEYGTGVRGDPGKASGQPYDIPKGRDDDFAFKPASAEMKYIAGYKYIRTKAGVVRSIPIYRKVVEDRGRRPGKKALKIMTPGGPIFRHSIKDHQGVPGRHFVHAALMDLREHYWEDVVKSTYSRVARWRGISR